MHPKLYICSSPYYLTERELRSALGGCPVHSLSVIQSVYGVIGVIELNSLNDSQRVTEVLSQCTLGECRLTVVPAESRAGQTIEEMVSRLSVKPNHMAPRTAA